MTNYWLIKSEPTSFSLDDLQQQHISSWDGVRNYQARNFMRDQMRIGDQLFFYHSNCKLPGIVGLAEVVRESYIDHTAFDPNSEHPDPSSTPDNPRWFMVDVRFVAKFSEIISLDELKTYSDLQNMTLLRKGNRLSVLPIQPTEWSFIMSLVVLDSACAV